MFKGSSPTTAALLSTGVWGATELGSGQGIWGPTFPGTAFSNHWKGDSMGMLCLSFPMAQGCQTSLLGRCFCFQGTRGGADPHLLA